MANGKTVEDMARAFSLIPIRTPTVGGGLLDRNPERGHTSKLILE